MVTVVFPHQMELNPLCLDWWQSWPGAGFAAAFSGEGGGDCRGGVWGCGADKFINLLLREKLARDLRKGHGGCDGFRFCFVGWNDEFSWRMLYLRKACARLRGCLQHPAAPRRGRRNELFSNGKTGKRKTHITFFPAKLASCGRWTDGQSRQNLLQVVCTDGRLGFVQTLRCLQGWGFRGRVGLFGLRFLCRVSGGFLVLPSPPFGHFGGWVLKCLPSLRETWSAHGHTVHLPNSFGTLNPYGLDPTADALRPLDSRPESPEARYLHTSLWRRRGQAGKSIIPQSSCGLHSLQLFPQRAGAAFMSAGNCWRSESGARSRRILTSDGKGDLERIASAAREPCHSLDAAQVTGFTAGFHILAPIWFSLALLLHERLD